MATESSPAASTSDFIKNLGRMYGTYTGSFVGFVILIASSLSFLGLGVQPPTPDLGSMVAEGARYLPDLWWLAIFPGLAVLVAVIGFNLLGDGVNDLLDIDR